MSEGAITYPDGATYSEGVGVELLEQFTEVRQQRHAATLGMWSWLLTELLLFAALFLIALVLRIEHPDSVKNATHHLEFWIGAANTAVLIVSSLTMSGAIITSRMGLQTIMVRCMYATAALGTLFLVLKGYEYYKDYLDHLTPFMARPYDLAGDKASILYVNLYYVATALHGFHLTTGVAILMVLALQARAPGYLTRHQNRIEIYGLYWHFIDLMWIMVFTIIYVMNR